MVVGPDFSTSAKPKDFIEIDNLVTAAFGRSSVAKFIHRLRADGDMWFETIKPWGGVIAGYCAVARMQSPIGWGCLACIAVLPKMQNGRLAPDHSSRAEYSVGTRLVSELTSSIQAFPRGRESETDVPLAIVAAGNPSFFERGGFSAKRAQSLIIPESSKQVLIVRTGDDVPEETLIFPPAFEEFDIC